LFRYYLTNDFHINKVLEKAKQTQEAEMSKVAQGMLPGIGGLFGK